MIDPLTLIIVAAVVAYCNRDSKEDSKETSSKQMTTLPGYDLNLTQYRHGVHLDAISRYDVSGLTSFSGREAGEMLAQYGKTRLSAVSTTTFDINTDDEVLTFEDRTMREIRLLHRRRRFL